MTLTHYKVTVLDAGVLRTEQIYKVAWTIGNTHVGLDSSPLGSYYADDFSVRMNQIRSWATATAPSATVRRV